MSDRYRKRMPLWALQIILLTMTLCTTTRSVQAANHGATSVFMEDLTSPELRELVSGGATTVLVPIGGTEQSGPQIALGKHNVRAHFLAGEIAKRLGNAVVAPVISYVPEGSITPPAAHMRFSGTISIPDSTFNALLEATARSLKQHGFRDVVFLGDHGGYQKNEEEVAARLNKEWTKDISCRVYADVDYYRVTQTKFVADLKSRGFSESEIGTHAGLADTALMLAVDKSLVRSSLLSNGTKFTVRDGVHGDPRRATVDLGEIGVQMILDASVSDIRMRVNKHSTEIQTTRK